MQAIEIYRAVSYVLQDVREPRRWAWTVEGAEEKANLPQFLNSAMRMVAIHRPDSTARMVNVPLVAGPRQVIPDDGVSLLELVRNMGTDIDNPTPGVPIIKVERSALDTYDPNWYQGDEAVEIYNYAYDKFTNPFVFWVAPSPQEGVVVEMVHSIDPPPVTLPEDILPMPGIYHSPIVHWMLYEIMSGDNSDVNYQKADHHYRAFHQVLGLKLETDARFPIKLDRGE